MSCLLCHVYFMKDCSQFEIYYTVTTHSNTLLVNYIKKILNWDLSPEDSKNLCKPCFDLFDELDYVEQTCSRLKKQISERCLTNTVDTFYYKDNSTQTSDIIEDDIEDKQLEVFSENILDALKIESSNVLKTPELTVDELINDIKVIREKKSKSYECEFCQKKFSSKSGVHLHTQRQHSNESASSEGTPLPSENSVKLECDVVIDECLKSENDNSDSQGQDDNVSTSSSRTRLGSNKGGKKKCSSAIKPLKYTCPQCPKMWRTLGELRSHVATHSNLRPYICEVCGQAYKHKQALDIHVGMHNGINPFSCNFCQKAFTQKGALQRHLPIHTGEAPYQCDLCGKRFVHHTSFNMHTLAHTGKKSYKCNTCGLALLSGSHLKRHMRVHTGERPYACNQCGKRFAERYNLAAHQRLHEAGPSELSRRLHRCQVCGAGFDRRPKLEEHLSNNHNKIAENDQSRKWVGHFLTNT